MSILDLAVPCCDRNLPPLLLSQDLTQFLDVLLYLKAGVPLLEAGSQVQGRREHARELLHAAGDLVRVEVADVEDDSILIRSHCPQACLNQSSGKID